MIDCVATNSKWSATVGGGCQLVQDTCLGKTDKSGPWSQILQKDKCLTGQWDPSAGSFVLHLRAQKILCYLRHLVRGQRHRWRCRACQRCEASVWVSVCVGAYTTDTGRQTARLHVQSMSTSQWTQLRSTSARILSPQASFRNLSDRWTTDSVQCSPSPRLLGTNRLSVPA